MLRRIWRRLTWLRCDGCGHRFDHLFHHEGECRCNPCIVRKLRVREILRGLERDGILTIIKEG